MGEVKNALDATAFVVTLSTWLGLLPNIAAGLSVIWIAIQIFDRIRRGK